MTVTALLPAAHATPAPPLLPRPTPLPPPSLPAPQPGLSAIITAVIGARKIFQRMTTYSRYTVAMTFRICFTFGLITVIYNWWVGGGVGTGRGALFGGEKKNGSPGPRSLPLRAPTWPLHAPTPPPPCPLPAPARYFPTILIVLLAVFNDGAMIALSKDTVTPSRLPNRWNLNSIFLSGGSLVGELRGGCVWCGGAMRGLCVGRLAGGWGPCLHLGHFCRADGAVCVWQRAGWLQGAGRCGVGGTPRLGARRPPVLPWLGRGVARGASHRTAPRPRPAGIGYGLYLTLSSWALYYVATHTDFFDGDIGMFSLQETQVWGGPGCGGGVGVGWTLLR